jgi:hypothetical protein
VAARLLAALCSLALAFATGWWRCEVSHQAAQGRRAVAASETLRTEEHDDATIRIKTLDSYAALAPVRQARALDARSDLVGVQQLLATLAAPAPASAAASACGPDPRLSGLAELLSEGTSLVEEGARVADELRDQRDALSRPISRHNPAEDEPTP